MGLEWVSGWCKDEASFDNDGARLVPQLQVVFWLFCDSSLCKFGVYESDGQDSISVHFWSLTNSAA